MKSKLPVFVSLVLIVWFGTSIGQAQTAALPKPTEVIDSFIDALGGEMAISSIRTMKISAKSGTAEVNYLFHEGQFLFETTFAEYGTVLFAQATMAKTGGCLAEICRQKTTRTI